jgi:hypothetical protein
MNAGSTTAALPVPAAGSADAVHALLAAGSIANVSYDLDTTLLPQAVHKKTARLLDALAAILVSRAQHEVIAIGAHSNDLSDHSGKLQLVLAANATLPQTIQAYLEEVWKYMQLLAEHHQQLRLPEAKDQVSAFSFNTPSPLNVNSCMHGWLNIFTGTISRSSFAAFASVRQPHFFFTRPCEIISQKKMSCSTIQQPPQCQC